MSTHTQSNHSHLRERAILSITDDVVREKTGRSWEEWDAVLDTCGAIVEGVDATARYLCEEFQLSTWWGRAVASRYHFMHHLP